MPVAVELNGLLPGRGPGRGPRWPGAPGLGAPPGRGAPEAGRGASWLVPGAASCGCESCGRGAPGRAAPGRGAPGAPPWPGEAGRGPGAAAGRAGADGAADAAIGAGAAGATGAPDAGTLGTDGTGRGGPGRGPGLAPAPGAPVLVAGADGALGATEGTTAGPPAAGAPSGTRAGPRSLRRLSPWPPCSRRPWSRPPDAADLAAAPAWRPRRALPCWWQVPTARLAQPKEPRQDRQPPGRRQAPGPGLGHCGGRRPGHPDHGGRLHRRHRRRGPA